jgi:hypothetical protein
MISITLIGLLNATPGTSAQAMYSVKEKEEQLQMLTLTRRITMRCTKKSYK